jgi:hypothetical protein
LPSQLENTPPHPADVAPAAAEATPGAPIGGGDTVAEPQGPGDTAAVAEASAAATAGADARAELGGPEASARSEGDLVLPSPPADVEPEDGSAAAAARSLVDRCCTAVAALEGFVERDVLSILRGSQGWLSCTERAVNALERELAEQRAGTAAAIAEAEKARKAAEETGALLQRERQRTSQLTAEAHEEARRRDELENKLHELVQRAEEAARCNREARDRYYALFAAQETARNLL